ncbi:zinc-ribbon domain-containing protein [Paracoccaceae bacterium]|nr:zinc-ribbon domain-containing protein [Paracoccaceae bacterium]
MRLVCPNCKANYEIPRHAVPIGGREVKCASCGHSWFQTRTEKSNDIQLIDPENKITKEDTEEVASAASNQKKIDPSVIKILKEEAKREIEARDKERNKKNIPSKNKKSLKNTRNSEPATLTKDAILKHQSKDALAEALDDKKTAKRSGFIFGLLIVLFALLAYTNSNQLVSVLPESEIYIVSYIELVDEIRLELNKLAGKVIYLVTNLI